MKSRQALSYGFAFILAMPLAAVSSGAMGNDSPDANRGISGAPPHAVPNEVLPQQGHSFVFTENATVILSPDAKFTLGLVRNEIGNRIAVQMANVTVETTQVSLKMGNGVLEAHIGDKDGLIHTRSSQFPFLAALIDWSNQVQRQNEAAKEIRKLGGEVRYSRGYLSFLGPILPPALVARVQTVYLFQFQDGPLPIGRRVSVTEIDEIITYLKRLPYLEEVVFSAETVFSAEAPPDLLSKIRAALPGVRTDVISL
jgi:hypothetical protein